MLNNYIMGLVKKQAKLTKRYMCRSFAGREEQVEDLIQMANSNRSPIVVVYGRRRVGKTCLIEHVFSKRQLLKFEGLEGGSPAVQRKEFLRQLALHFKNPLLELTSSKTWTNVLETLTGLLKNKKWTIYFEELQWLASYDDTLISAIKYFWDNHWRHNKQLVTILCGSAPSFMIHKVLRSKALYNRSEYDFPLQPFSFKECCEFLGRRFNKHEIMDAILAVGAIPPYLEKVTEHGSVYQSLVRECAKPNGYFVTEYEKIFTSSLAKSPDYRVILDSLAKVAFLDRQTLARLLKRAPGGSLSKLLEDLEISGFIASYTPIGKPVDSKLQRYVLVDPYLRLYYRYIKPKLKKINARLFVNRPESVIRLQDFRQLLGYSFERWTLSRQATIARLLGFEGISFDCGPYFSRSSQGTQIDLVYERADRTTTLIEIKYGDKPVGVEVITEFERKIACYPARKRSIEKVLLSAAGAEQGLIRKNYFDRIITLDDLLE